MRLIDRLEADHRLIDAVAGSFLAWARQGGPTAELERYVLFFREFVRDAHHRREEDVLFPSLVEHAEVPGDRGPLAVLRREHRELDTLLAAVEASCDRARAEAVTALVHHIWEHVDKESSVLFPAARRRLVRSGVPELPDLSETASQETARRAGEALVAARPPIDDPEVVRSEGCVGCAAFAYACHGLEAEWWNELEWGHYRSIDDG
jgi:iron-sulfur cluster repair protein YtfE (RIC family)